jgi:MFS family permease
MGYFKELLTQWRPLAAALIGLGSGYSLTIYTTSIMAPHMIAEFGWTRADFTLVSSVSLPAVAMFPLVGRLADVIGVRRTALIGVIALPLAYLALSAMRGDLTTYIALYFAQSVICITTTTTVYSRIVVQYVKKARGLALAIVASGPAITGAILGPMLNDYVVAEGWRQGYIALLVFAVLAGGFALLLMPSEQQAADPASRPQPRRARDDYPAIAKTPAFWLMFGAMLLINLPLVIAHTSLNLMLADNGVTPAHASGMISAFAIGVLAGRFLSGLALDRFPAHLVAAIGLGVPGLGLFMLASGFDAPIVIMIAVFMFGLSNGAEGDVVGFLVVRNFGVGVYSSVLGLMTLAMATASSLGAALLSLTLRWTDSFALFLTIGGCTVVLGSLLFLFLKKPGAEIGAPRSLS